MGKPPTEKAQLIEKIINKEVPTQNDVLRLQWAVQRRKRKCY